MCKLWVCSKGKSLVYILLASLIVASCVPATPETTPIPVPLTINIQQNIQYLTAIDPEASDQLLDIYWPEEKGPWPVVVYTHGSTESKDKDLSKEFGKAMAEQGAVVFVIDYDPNLPDIMILKNGRAFRELAETASCSVRYAREKAPEYNGNPDQIIWVGFSAGGYTGVMASIHRPDQFDLWDAFAAKRGGPGQQIQCTAAGGSDQVNDLVMASGLFYLPTNMEEKDAELGDMLEKIYEPGANMQLRVRMLHGLQDNLVRYNVAEELYNLFNETGYDVELMPTAGGHGLYIEQVIELVNALR